jgi:hypothetical protein
MLRWAAPALVLPIAEAGNEYVLVRRPILLSLLTFGMYVRPCLTIQYNDIPSVGRFEGDRFEPARWKSTFPNRAMLNARPDDLFWAARRVMAFSTEAIRAVVASANYSDPRATETVVDALIKRRDKIGREWLASVNPLVEFAIDGGSQLTFNNAAVTSGVSIPHTSYGVRWFHFDNADGTMTAVGTVVTAERTCVPLPGDLRSGTEFIAADISAVDPQHLAWQQPVRVFFRRSGENWNLVGVERLPSRSQGSLSLTRRVAGPGGAHLHTLHPAAACAVGPALSSRATTGNARRSSSPVWPIRTVPTFHPHPF